MNKSRQRRDILLRKIEAGHAFLDPAIANYNPNLVSAYVLRHQGRTREVRTGFAAACVPAMAEGALLSEERTARIDQRLRCGLRGCALALTSSWVLGASDCKSRARQNHHQATRNTSAMTKHNPSILFYQVL